MKKHLKIMLVILLSAGSIVGCKKSSTSDSKDATQSIKDKTWWGMITYTGKTTEYYSVHFNTDNTLTWSQLSGDYTGHWIINGTELTLTFDLNTVQIKAGISDDHTLINITDNTSIYEINSGGMIIDPAIPLDNTVWKGFYISGGSQLSLQLRFSPGSVIIANYGTLADQKATYIRSSSGSVIRYGIGGMYPFFAVISSGNEIKGSSTSSAYPLQVLKQ
jgi:hypothetical protein